MLELLVLVAFFLLTIFAAIGFDKYQDLKAKPARKVHKPELKAKNTARQGHSYSAHKYVKKYEAKTHLITDTELKFLQFIDEVLDPAEYRIFAMVRVADVLKAAAQRYVKGSTYRHDFNQISNKHFDFVVCERTTLKILFVIELDDYTHTNNRRTIKSDAVKNAACWEAGLPLVRIPVKSQYSVTELQEQLSGVFDITVTSA